MDIKQIEFIKNNKPKDMSIPELAQKSDISVITLRRMLNPNSGYNPTMKTLTKLATPLGLTAQEILAAKDFDDDMYLGVSGYIDFLGEITRIKSKKDLDKIYNEICAKVQAPKAAEKIEKEEKAIVKKQSKSPIDIASINLFEGLDTEIYDTSKVSTWSFRKSDDVVEGEANDLGNMCKGFEFDVCEEHFFNSECAYIVGMFSQNDPQSIKIQRELQASDNGYSAKKDIRHKYEVRGLNRKDWNEFNVEWMKYVVWQKCKQNKAFQKRLSRIPSNAIIVENSTHQKKRQNDTSAFWGARNYELEKKRDVVELAAEVKNYKLTKKEIEVEKMKARNTIHHFGVWVGNNCMGKILTICKHCLDNGTEPNIDYDLLRSKQIYLFGKLLTFDDAPKAQETQFPEPTEPLKAKAKEMPTRRKKSSQEVRKSVDGNVKGIIGAVIGEVIGSRFEFSKPPTRKVDRFTAASTFTDDTVLTVAVADALLHNRDFGEAIFDWARKYPNAGFGMRFRQLMKGKKGISTDSLGNGGGMRVSPIGFHAKTLEEALELARLSAIPSHNSVEGIKGAQSIAAATFLAKQQLPKEEIKAYIEKEFGYNLDMSDEEITEFVSNVRSEKKTEWAENTCPLAIIAFLTTDDYESSIWKSISYGCDTDTVACMCGGIAAAYYGVPQDIINEVTDYLPHEILNIINEFDHTNLQNSRITPKKYDRWGASLVYGSGSDQIVDEKGHVIDEGGFEARQHFGASLKVTEGFKKRSYAIPTMGRTLNEIRESVDRFIKYAEDHQEETFMVIEIGCKKAGFTPKQIAPMFERAKSLSNVYLPNVFIEVPKIWEQKTRKKMEKED